MATVWEESSDVNVPTLVAGQVRLLAQPFPHHEAQQCQYTEASSQNGHFCASTSLTILGMQLIISRFFYV
jgi:hypothetical protein